VIFHAYCAVLVRRVYNIIVAWTFCACAIGTCKLRGGAHSIAKREQANYEAGYGCIKDSVVCGVRDLGIIYYSDW
jgi:hypothetical protein